MAEHRRLRPMDPSVSPRFGDVATLLRAPRVPLGPGIEIALVGVPFDLGTNYRTGARGGPAAVREASRTIRLVHPSSRIAPFDLCEVADVGDVAINAMDLGSVSGDRSILWATARTACDADRVGGDHTVPLPILRVIARQRPVGVVQFDAHPDTLDTLMGTRINHATTFRRAVEEGLIDPRRTVQVGLRGSKFSADDAAGVGKSACESSPWTNSSSSAARASSRRSAASLATARPMSASTSMGWMQRTLWEPACRRSAAIPYAMRR